MDKIIEKNAEEKKDVKVKTSDILKEIVRLKKYELAKQNECILGTSKYMEFQAYIDACQDIEKFIGQKNDNTTK